MNNEFELKEIINEVEENGIVYEKRTVFKVYEDGTEEIAYTVKHVKEKPSEPQATQLDRIEEQLAARNDALRQEGADALTLELLERGIL